MKCYEAQLCAPIPEDIAGIRNLYIIWVKELKDDDLSRPSVDPVTVGSKDGITMISYRNKIWYMHELYFFQYVQIRTFYQKKYNFFDFYNTDYYAIYDPNVGIKMI